MKLQFWSVGRAHEPYVQTGVEEFTRRISNYFPVSWNIIAPPRQSGPEPQQIVSKENDLLLSMVGRDDFVVALDERGTQLDSRQFASFMQARANESTRSLVFLIGGAYGLGEGILQRAGFRWSLSSLTFPHQLVRLVLSEQVYRACTIMRNEKYHH